MLSLWSLGHLYRIKGDSSEAVALLERAVAVESDRQMWPGSAGPLGYCYALAGRVAEGIALMEEMRAAMDSVGWRPLKARMVGSLGHAYLIGGRPGEAQLCADEALALARQRGERGSEAWLLWLQGEIASRREPLEVASAAESYRQSLTLGAELGMRPVIAHCHLGLGELYRRAGKPEADEHLLGATRLSRAMGMSAWLSRPESGSGR